MDYLWVMESLLVTDVIARVGLAVVCGALVGVERERKQRPAGFRTMILISLGSCGFVLLGHEAVAQMSQQSMTALPPGTPSPGPAEISRVLQGLIGGIGFLGAGAVIQNKRAVRGITTAAAVWVVAAMGAACGLGLYMLASILAGATLFTLVVLELVENRFFPDPKDADPGPRPGIEADERSDLARRLGPNGRAERHAQSDAPVHASDEPSATAAISNPRTTR
jgi:putative Mg2+ transporter-C (MgtC) family protein